MFDWLLKFHVD
jgi:hypothetical protein